jgi:acyl-CoA thioester hydrolase
MAMAEAAMPQALATGVHVFPVRVYYEDTDAAGIVYHANYLRFAERARSEMMRLLGVEHSRLMERDGVAFAVSRCEVDFHKPARLDDVLEVHTRVTELKRASLAAEQVIKRGGAVIARLLLRIAVIDRAGRPVRLPAELRNALTNLSKSESHS